MVVPSSQQHKYHQIYHIPKIRKHNLDGIAEFNNNKKKPDKTVMYIHHISTFFTWQGNTFFAYFNRLYNELQMYEF